MISIAVHRATAVTGRHTVRGRQSGFTYLAVLLAVALAGATLAAVGQVWQTVAQREKEKELLFVGNQIRKAINGYFKSNGNYPMALEDLVLDSRSAGVKRYLRKVFVDPMTGSSAWGTLKSADGQVFGVYSLSELEPLKKSNFSLQNAGFENKLKYSEWIFVAAGRGLPNNPPANTVAATPQRAGKK